MSDESYADIVLDERGESRRLRMAAVIAILFHFALFMAVLPMHGRVYEIETRQATVIKRYRPPEPPKKTKPMVRHPTRVPVPDQTPFEPEPLLDAEPEPVLVEPADTELLVGAPTSRPEPSQLAGAVDIEAEGVVPPKLVRRVRPQYDPDRARRGVQGKVDLQIVIDETGVVEFARIVNGTEDDELDRQALVAVQQWQFEPATMDGVAVPCRAMVTINYRIY